MISLQLMAYKYQQNNSIILKFHKPAGYITAVEDPTHPVVMDLLPPEFKKMGVFPVGR